MIDDAIRARIAYIINTTARTDECVAEILKAIDFERLVAAPQPSGTDEEIVRRACGTYCSCSLHGPRDEPQIARCRDCDIRRDVASALAFVRAEGERGGIANAANYIGGLGFALQVGERVSVDRSMFEEWGNTLRRLTPQSSGNPGELPSPAADADRALWAEADAFAEAAAAHRAKVYQRKKAQRIKRAALRAAAGGEK